MFFKLENLPISCLCLTSSCLEPSLSCPGIIPVLTDNKEDRLILYVMCPVTPCSPVDHPMLRLLIIQHENEEHSF